MYTQPLEEGQFFHIYNRGVNGENLFKEDRNYHFFLQQYQAYCSDVFDTYAYALLKNHFHLVVYVKANVEVPRYKGEGMIRLNASKQLGHCFNSYAQTINKAFNRTGQLFESPFERKLIHSNTYLTSLIFYCHYNPQLHDFVKDFKDWPHTSYYNILNSKSELVATDKVLDWFGSIDAFVHAHEDRYPKFDAQEFLIE